MRIVHAADLHLDSPLRGLARLDEEAPVDLFRTATRRAYDRLIELCISERAKALLLAGDVFDGDLRDHHAGIHFARRLERLERVGCRVLMVLGNHDHGCEVAKAARLPKNVTVFGSDGPETVVMKELGLAVHGQSYGRRNETRDLSSAYPDPVAGLLNVGLLHTNASGSTEHEPYAPCTVPSLVAKGYDYWALGHVHGHAVLHADPWVVYPGNLQGRHARETGPKGAVVIDVEDGRVTGVAFRSLDVVRWEVLRLDLAGVGDLDELYECARAGLEDVRERTDGGPVIVRVELVGATALHDRIVQHRHRVSDEIRACAWRAGDVWAEKIRIRTSPPATADREVMTGLQAALHAEMEALGTDDDVLEVLREGLTAFGRSTGRHLDASPDTLEEVRRRLPRAEALLRALLFAAPDGAAASPEAST